MKKIEERDIIDTKRGVKMKLQESGEMYLETIYMLKKEISAVRSIDVCEKMGYSKPSVSRAMGLLRKGGYVEVDEHGFISLTPLGLEVAESMAERHAIISSFLTSLGVKEEIAAIDACKIEHVISEEAFAAIKNAMKAN